MEFYCPAPFHIITQGTSLLFPLWLCSARKDGLVNCPRPDCQQALTGHVNHHF